MQMLYARGLQKTDYKSEKPLYVNNCGLYRGLDSDINVSRPHGRNDYHVLMVSSGSIRVGGKELDMGKAWLYYPSTPQKYTYRAGEGTEYYWLHFSGRLLEELLEKYGIREGVTDLGNSRGEAERLFKMMLRALSENYGNADDYCEGLLRSFMALYGAPPRVSSPYHKAIQILSDPKNDQSVNEIAAMYGVSANHFIRDFKRYVGKSPNAYRLGKRMEAACEMLVSTDLPVERIAGEVGYADALYFSRAFRKHVGASPTQYRKSKVLLP